jgi:hypothetical protein
MSVAWCEEWDGVAKGTTHFEPFRRATFLAWRRKHRPTAKHRAISSALLKSWHNLRISSGTAISYYDGRWPILHIATERSVTLAAGFHQCHADDKILPETRQVPLPPVHCSVYRSQTILSLDTIKPRLFWLLYEGNSISKLQIQVANYVFELSAGNCHR